MSLPLRGAEVGNLPHLAILQRRSMRHDSGRRVCRCLPNVDARVPLLRNRLDEFVRQERV